MTIPATPIIAYPAGLARPASLTAPATSVSSFEYQKYGS